MMPLSALVRTRICIATMTLLVAQAGCARQQPVDASSPDSGYVSLIFANESPLQAEVWALAPDVNTRRIATVMAGETSTIRVPADFTEQGRVSFYAKVRGTSGQPFTETYSIHAGDELRVRLERDAKKLSSFQSAR